MLKKIVKALKNPKLILLYLLKLKIARIIPDRVVLKIQYKLHMDKTLNLNSPKTFNEKLQWLKLYSRSPDYIKMVDKHEVKKYIEEKLGAEYVISLIGVWEKFDDIDFNVLPNQFVLKCTHDSGGVVICKDKNKFNIEAARQKLNKSLKRNYYYLQREWPYKNVKPRIICEQFMSDELCDELKDYKFMCFNGKVKCSFVCLNRNSDTGLNVDFYNINWERMPFERHYKRGSTPVSKPKNYDLMISLSEKLAKGIAFVRIDFYEINNKVYFGEITFFPGSGYEEFTPDEYDRILGDWIMLPKMEKKYERTINFNWC